MAGSQQAPRWGAYGSVGTTFSVTCKSRRLTSHFSWRHDCEAATSALSLEAYAPHTSPNINFRSLVSVLQWTFPKVIKVR
jgi:hypothetical protein